MSPELKKATWMIRAFLSSLPPSLPIEGTLVILDLLEAGADSLADANLTEDEFKQRMTDRMNEHWDAAIRAKFGNKVPGTGV